MHCDPSGYPQSEEMLPITHIWRTLFGPRKALPLWIGYAPGSLFAVSRAAVLARRPGDELLRDPSRLYERAASLVAHRLTHCVAASERNTRAAPSYGTTLAQTSCER